jgi:hypothetical protein
VQVLGQRLTEIVNVGIFPEWYTEIVEAGFHRQLIRSINCKGMQVWSVSCDRSAWTEAVSALLRNQKLAFPAQ